MKNAKNKKNKKLFFLFLLVFTLFFSFNISAEKVEIEQNNGLLISTPQQEYIEKGEHHRFNFHLSKLDDGTLVTDNDTICRFTLYDQKGDIILFTNASYNNDNTNNWNVVVPGGNLTRVGEYSYYISCTDNLNKLGGIRSKQFSTTATGKKFGIEESIIYVILISLLITLFILSLNMCINTPWDKGNDAAKVNYQKYLKFLYGVLSYIFMMFIMFTGKGLTQYFLPADTIYSFFNVFSTIMIVAMGPLLIAVTFFVALSIMSDKRNANALKRNLPQEVRK